MPDQLDQLLDEQPAAAPPPIKPVAEPVTEPSTSPPKKRSKPHVPFTQADRIRIGNLVRAGLSAPEIASRVKRGLPQVSRIVRELAAATKPTSVPVLINDSKVTCSAKTWAALAAAAKRRHLEPALLAVQIIDGVVRHRSIDGVLHNVERADDLQALQVILNLEPVGHMNGATGATYRLRGVALATNFGCSA